MDVYCVRLFEEAPDQPRLLLHCRQIPHGTLGNALSLAQRGAARIGALRLTPRLLLRIEFRGVGGQTLGSEPAFTALRQTDDGCTNMHRLVVQHDDHRASAPPHEPLQKGSEPCRSERSPEDLPVEGSARAHHADGIDRRAPNVALHHRRLALGSPCAPHLGIGAKIGFIEEKDLGARGECLALERRETPALPILDGPGFALPRSRQGTLRRQFQLAQEPADSLHAVADAPALPDQIPDDDPRPEAEVESILARVLSEDEAPDPGLLLRRQAARCAGGLATAQAAHRAIAFLHARHPLVVGRARHAITGHDAGDVLGGLHSRYGVHADCFNGFAVQSPAVTFLHGPTIANVAQLSAERVWGAADAAASVTI
jgi:hypothetical protein